MVEEKERKKLAEVRIVDEATVEEMQGIKKALRVAGLLIEEKGREIKVLVKG